MATTFDTSMVELLISDRAGIYIPQEWHDGFYLAARERYSGISDDDLAIVASGPDHEWYWESWDMILNNATYTDDAGHTWNLHQNGDLWAIRTDADIPEEWFYT